MAEENVNPGEALKDQEGGAEDAKALEAEVDGSTIDEVSKVENDPEEVIDAVYEVSIDVTAVLGTSNMPISQVLKLGRGAVVELDRFVGEEIELFAEENLIAKGEVVVVDDQLAVNITKIIKRL